MPWNKYNIYDELLVSGYIKDVFEQNKMIMPSEDIINLIGMFYDSEVLHVIGGEYQHTEQRAYMTDHQIISVSAVVN